MALKQKQYESLKHVKMVLVVHRYPVKPVDGELGSLKEFKKKMKQSLAPLLNASTFHFKLTVRAFNSSP